MSAQANPFFAPTQISGCAVWLDAFRVNGQSMSAQNSLVASWTNLVSGGSNFTQATTSRQPTFLQNGLATGYPSLYFNSSNTAASIQFLFAGPNVQTTRDISFFYVSKYTDVGNANQTQFDQRKDVVGVALRTFKAAQYQLRDPAGNLYSLNYTANTSPSIKSYRDTLNTSLGYFDGTLVTSSTGAYNQQVADNYGTLIGSHFNANIDSEVAAATFSKVFISEVLIYNRFLSVQEQQQVEGYLAWKWGLQANLPSSHPYKSSPIAPLLNPPRSLPALLQNTTASFLPSQVSGLTIWLDAADASSMTLSGSNVTLWRDKSGKGKNATTNSPVGPTLTTTPEFMNTSLYFNSSNYMLIPNNTLVNANGIFFVVFQEDTGQTSQKFVIQNYKAFGIQEFQYDTQSTTIASGSFYTASFASRITSFSITAAEVLQTTGKLNSYTNGSLTQSVTVATSSATGDTDDGTNIGRYTFNNSEGYVGRFKGYLAEILYFNTTVPVAQRQQIEGYLAWKWGLQAKLPFTHPYKMGPPYSATITAPSRSLAQTVTWQPNQISGCQLWLDAADISVFMLTGSNVTQWNDKSGNGYNAIPRNVARTPVRYNGFNGRPTVESSVGSATGNVLLSTIPSSNIQGPSGFSFFMVSRFFSGDVFLQYESPRILSLEGTARFDYGQSNVVYSYPAGFTNTSNHILNLNLTTASSTIAFSYNGSFLSNYAVNNVTSQFTTSLGIFGRGGLADNAPGYGQISELLIFNSSLLLSQRQQVEGYLAWKWGLVANLPATHPYKLWPPPP